MPLLKKNGNESHVAMLNTDVHRRVLQRCRLILLKDLDVSQVLESLRKEECVSTEECDDVLTLSSRQHRVAVLLDKLEVRSQKAFSVFMDSLREHYRHLHSVLDESVRTIDSMEHDDTELERVLLTGDDITKLLKRAYSDSQEKQNLLIERHENDYIECFSVTKQSSTRSTQSDCVKHMTSDVPDGSHCKNTARKSNYMAVLTSDLIFSLVDPSDIPSSVKQPPQPLVLKAGGVYVADKDQRPPTMILGRSVSSVSTHRNQGNRTNDNVFASASRNRNHIPPPVPIKPADLPPLSFNIKPPILKNRSVLKDKSNGGENNDASKLFLPISNSLTKPARVPPRNTIERVEPTTPSTEVVGNVMNNCCNTIIDQSYETESDDVEMPPLPPRLDKLPRSPIELHKRPLSSVSEESGTPRELSPMSVNISRDIVSPVLDKSSEGKNIGIDHVVHHNIDASRARKEYFARQNDELSRDDLVSSENIASVAAIVEVFESKSPTGDQPPMLKKCSRGNSNTTNSAGDSIDSNSDEPAQSTVRVVNNSSINENVTTFSDNVSLKDNDSASHDSETSMVDTESLSSDINDDVYEPVGQQSRQSTSMVNEMLDMPVEVSESESVIDDQVGQHAEDNDSTKDSGIETPRSPRLPLPIPPRANTLSSPTPRQFGEHEKDEGTLPNDHLMNADDTRSTCSESTISTFSDVDYEDIESVVNRVAPPSSVSGKSYQYYLDPKSYTHSMDFKFRVPTFVEADSSGKILLHSGELLIADHDDALNAQTFYKNTTFDIKNDEAKQDMKETSSVSTDTVDESNYLNSSTPYQHTKLCTDKIGRILYIPVKHLKRHGDPTDESWFYPIPLTPCQATLFLSQESLEGCFLVYEPCGVSMNAGIHRYILSVGRQGGHVMHYGIVEGIHGDVSIVGHKKSFMSVVELVKYFQSNKSQLITRLRRPLMQATLNTTPGIHYPAKWELNRTTLQLNGQIIGKGQFGVVCGGTYQHRSVAVKILQRVDLSTSRTTSTDNFLDEAQILMMTRHEHITRLIGVSCSLWPHYIVLEYYPKGNMRDCLRCGDIPVEHIDLLFDLCIQVTSALTYLYSQHYIVHRDVCARNFLVTADLCVKLCNFGRARKLIDDSCHCDSDEKISIKWAAPEVMSSCSYSTKSDIWSLGVVLWEVFSYGQPPYVTLTGEQTAVYVLDGGVLEKPAGCSPDIYSIMKSCWHIDPTERPTVSALADRLASKSSIYYGPIQPRPISTHSTEETLKLPLSRHSTSNRNSTTSLPSVPPPIPAPNKSGTPGAGASNPNGVISPITSSSTKSATLACSRSTVYATRMEEYAREYMENSLREQNERGLHTSNSESSLNNGGHLSNNKDDMTRSHKIRKSLRKVLHVKTTKRKNSKSDNNSTGSDRNSYSYSMYHNN